MAINLGRDERDDEGTAEYPPGTVLAERYRIMSTAGRGGMGLVYKVEQIFLKKILALKTIDRKNLSDTAVRRFQHEARATFAVSHPNIVSVHDFGLLDDVTPFLVMDFVAGETLAQLIAHSGSGVPTEQAIPIFIQVCFGLAAAHDAGIVHRDLKPSNIIIVKDSVIGAEGSVKVVDFGIAKLTQHDGGEIQALTRTGEIFGSPLYMSPEQCKSGRVDHRSDIYSLGCVLFEALSGAPPFIGDSALTTMMQHQTERTPTLRQVSLGKEFPRKLESILAKMLEKDPADRYQNLGLVAHALASVIGSASVGDDEPIRQRTTEKKSASATKTVTLSRTMLVLFFIAVAAMFSIAGYLFGTQNRGATGHPAPVAANPPATAREVDPHSPTDRALTQEAEKHFFGQEADDTTFVKMALQKPINGGEMSLTGIFLTRPMFKMVVDTNWVISTKWNSCHFIGHNFDLLSKKTNLNSLFASDTNFDDVDAAQISHSPNLERLEVARTGLTDKGIVEFARLKHLVNLQISETAVSGRGIAALANNPRLAVLRIRNCKEITDAALAPLAHSQLTTIDLSFIKPISDGALAYVEKDNHLVFVNLEGTGISAQGVDHMLSTNRSLQEVAIAGCPHISAQELEGLRQKFPSVIFSAPLSKSLP